MFQNHGKDAGRQVATAANELTTRWKLGFIDITNK